MTLFGHQIYFSNLIQLYYDLINNHKVAYRVILTKLSFIRSKNEQSLIENDLIKHFLQIFG